MDIKHILVVWHSEGDNTRLIKYSNKLLESIDAAVSYIVPLPKGVSKEEDKSEAKALMAKVHGQFEAGGADINRFSIEVCNEEDLSDSISSLATNHSVDLCIKIAGDFSSGFNSDINRKLVVEAQCPLLLMNEEQPKQKPHILATIDIDENNKHQKQLNDKVLDVSFKLAKLSKAELYAVYNLSISALLDELEVIEPRDLLRKKGSEAKNALLNIVGAKGIRDDHALVVAGEFSKSLASTAAEHSAYMVVIGTQKRKGVNRALFGNSAEQILKNLRHDLLVVPT